jgi:MFS family permease
MAKTRVFSASQIFITLNVLTNFPFFIFSAYYIAFLKFNGLNYTEMGIIFAVSAITIGILDFPTGNFADRYGRKKSIVLAIVSVGCGMILYGMAKEIITFAVGEFFIGLGTAFMSGSLEAWFYDELQRDVKQTEQKTEQKAAGTFGMGMGLMNITAILAGFFATFLAGVSISLPFLASGGLLLITALFALLLLNENYGERRTPYTVFLKEAFSKVSESNPLRWLVAGIAMFNVAYLFYMFTYQPFLLKEGLDIVFLGWMFSILMIVRALFSFLSSFLGKRIPHTKLNYWAPMILGMGYAVMAFANNLVIAVIGLILCEICIGFWFPTSMVWRNEIIPSTHRATLLSFMSTVSSLVMGFFVLAIGPLIDILMLNQAYLIAVVCSLLSASILYKASILHKKEKMMNLGAEE